MSKRQAHEPAKMKGESNFTYAAAVDDDIARNDGE
jgi:hypothetical protein